MPEVIEPEMILYGGLFDGGIVRLPHASDRSTWVALCRKDKGAIRSVYPLRSRQDPPRPQDSSCDPRRSRALGLLLGIWSPWVGLAAGVGLVLYFVGAVVSHLRVSDIKGIGPAVFMLLVAVATLALSVLTHTADTSN